MTPDELLLTRRSVRRYSQTPVPVETLREIVDVARYAPSGGNAQKWDVILAHEPETVAKVFPTLGWLPVTGAPPEGARPTAYAVVAAEGKPNEANCSSLVVYLLLAAHARGMGTCWFGSIDRKELAEAFGFPEGY
ncbi:MAG: nitroreductase family protein, partial [Candidatus Brocadiia bacterium]|nr:nitroreductase family protein [Candidatus Brocadiia bacterium]